ncbi:MAG: hypothetical protein QM791_18575 [Ferruginibacter sp.]
MKLISNSILFLLYFLLPLQLLAQKPDITGVWKGELVFKDTVVVHLPFEIAVSEEKDKLTGYSRITFHANDRDEFGMQNISLKWEGDNIVIEDEGFVEHDFSINPSRHIKKTMVMKLVTSDTDMVLSGEWSTNRTRRYMKSVSGTSVLKRKVDFKSSALFKRLDTMKLAEKLSFKDRPETTFIAKVTPPPVEKKPLPETAPVAEPDAEQELIIPAVEKATFAKMAVTKNRQAAVAKVTPPSKQKKAQMDAVAKTVIKPPVVKPAPAVTVPAEVAVKPAPKKPAPVEVAKNDKPVVEKPAPVKNTAPPEKKPEEVAVKPAPKPVVQPPAVIIAPSLTQGAAEIDKRTTKADQSFYFESDSLVLTLYDNGEVDGDTVTVLMNGGIIFSKVGLTTKPNTKTVYITSNMDSVKLVMYAESLGEIPPNTGLLIVNDGEKRYDVRFSADLKTNAGIVLRRRKNE